MERRRKGRDEGRGMKQEERGTYRGVGHRDKTGKGRREKKRQEEGDSER